MKREISKEGEGNTGEEDKWAQAKERYAAWEQTGNNILSCPPYKFLFGTKFAGPRQKNETKKPEYEQADIFFALYLFWIYCILPDLRKTYAGHGLIRNSPVAI